MKVLATYAPFGVRPCYYADDSPAHGDTIRQVMERGVSDPDWDLEGVQSYLKRMPDGWRTCFASIHAVPPGHVLVAGEAWENCVLRESTASVPGQESLVALLEAAVAGLVSDGRRAAVALSGGLDSALLVAILRRLGFNNIPVFTLASQLPGYCERVVTAEAARRLGVKDLQVIETSGRDMIGAFPTVIVRPKFRYSICIRSAAGCWPGHCIGRAMRCCLPAMARTRFLQGAIPGIICRSWDP